MKSLLATLALTTSLTLPGLAIARPVTLSTTLNTYGGDGAYLALYVTDASGGAFDIGMGDAVTAWGFGPDTAAPDRIRAAIIAARVPAREALNLNIPGGRVRKTAPIALDLNGIAKGYGVDRCTPHSVLSLQDAAVATSGDYRHWVDVQGRRLSHTMDPCRGAPVLAPPASVTVVARTCAEADAWATAFMVLGIDAGAKLAEQHGLDALFLVHDKSAGFRTMPVGRLFSDKLPQAVLGAGP